MNGRLFSWVYKHAGIYKKYNSDIEKGSACRSLFYSAYAQSEKILLNQYKLYGAESIISK